MNMGSAMKCFWCFAGFIALFGVILELELLNGFFEGDFVIRAMESPDSIEYIESNVGFYLYTRLNPTMAQVLEMNNKSSVLRSNLDLGKKTIVIAHGYSAFYEGITATRLRDAYINLTDYNVISIDYGQLAFTIWKVQLLGHSYKIGKYTGRFFLFLADCGLNLRLVHMMGHSIGAHIVGFAGKEVKRAGKLVGRITGLDPSNLGYGKNSPEYRLAPDDAQFTDCITTNFGKMGIGIPVCQANYFANSAGAQQPGCFYLDFGGGCSHCLVIEYFKESIDRSCTFKVRKCDRIPYGNETKYCYPTNETVMGEYANTELRGHFLFETSWWSPYCPRQSTSPTE